MNEIMREIVETLYRLSDTGPEAETERDAFMAWAHWVEGRNGVCLRDIAALERALAYLRDIPADAHQALWDMFPLYMER